MQRDAISGESIKRVRGGRGLGDALYVRAIVDHLAREGAKLSILSDYPQVFIGAKAHSVRPFERIRVDVTAHYVGGKKNPATTQWQDVCESVGVDAPLRVDWKPQSKELARSIRERAHGRPVILVHGGRRPMDRRDGFGIELMPSKTIFDLVLDELSDCFLVQIGRAEKLYELKCSLDLNGSTSVADLLDIALLACDGVVAQCSFAIPLAEVFDRPLLAVWGSNYQFSREPFIRQTSPKKVLSGKKDCYVMDNWDAALIREAARMWSERMREERSKP